jgi:hypothetical protein
MQTSSKSPQRWQSFCVGMASLLGYIPPPARRRHRGRTDLDALRADADRLAGDGERALAASGLSALGE